MTTFIIVAALMVAAALAWVLWPLLRPSNRTSVERRMVNLSVYKDQFADLDADFARGSISEDNYKEAKAELERRMLEESRAEKAAPVPVPVGGVKTALVIGAAIPVIAGLLYAKLGAPDAFSPLATAPQDQHQLSGAQIDEMTTKLAARLANEPDNVDGWVMLARTYYQQRKFPEAAQAYDKLTKLLPNEADLYADYADALAMAQGRRLGGQPMELVKKALELDPNQWKALAMAGTEAFDRKDYKSAITYWERLKANAGNEPIGKQIQASIDEARQLAGLPPSAPTAPVAAAASKAAPAPAAKADVPAASGGQSVSGTVTIEKGLAAKASPTDAVFVYARPADGSKMPIALTRGQVKDLPLKFTLDDTTSMNPQVKMSAFQEVILVARVSKSGSAMPASGDLEGLSKPVKLGSSGVAVTIDRALP
ncbi:MAG TPA: c-type cytochrome biogenesis protein CcmI [Burkholderiaceae bacterium]|nr:c-type cytochrome biogenesis protein CcmI [Burkholderiaceae bacterium]